MNVFEEVKTHVTARQAAEYYGIKVGRNGMACCPFHPDKNPSMKIDKRYFCFGCGEKGDVINFVGNLYGLRPIDTAEKIIEDFQILQLGEQGKPRKARGPTKEKTKKTDYQVEQDLEKWLQYCVVIMSDYLHLLQGWRVEHAPKKPEETWHPLFLEAMKQLELVNYKLDILLDGELEEKIEFLINEGKEVARIEGRIRKYESRDEGKSKKGGGEDGQVA